MKQEDPQYGRLLFFDKTSVASKTLRFTAVGGNSPLKSQTLPLPLPLNL